MQVIATNFFKNGFFFIIRRNMPIMIDSDFGGRWKGGVWRNTPQNTINVEKYTTRICEKSVRRRDTRDGTPSSKGDVFFQKKYCIIEKYILSLQAE